MDDVRTSILLQKWPVLVKVVSDKFLNKGLKSGGFLDGTILDA